MKILVLGAAGQIGQLVTENLRNETSHELVLFARSGNQRLEIVDPERETIIDGDFNDARKLREALEGVDLVYLNDMQDDNAINNIIDTMKESGVDRLIGASVLDVYDEVIGEFGEWNRNMIGHMPVIQREKENAKTVEESGLDYTLLRLTWLYNDSDNEAYSYTLKGEPFVGAQVTRQAAARLVMDIIGDDTERYSRQSLGVYEPGSEEMTKPSFY